MRTVILHYHLFKNAGTSLDNVLKQNFADRWVTREFPGQNNTAQVIEWIQDTPEAVAFSSHTMMGPLPRIEGVRVVSIMLLRDPIDRIKSAYRFERNQDVETFGAVLARHTDLEGYVKVRLSMPHDRQCRNFQTQRLSALSPGQAPEFARAMGALDLLSVVGLVSDFSGTLHRLADAVSDVFPDFRCQDVHDNRTPRAPEEDDEITMLLRSQNADDLALIDHVKRGWGAPVPAYGLS
ncbi:MAG: sulfotransferase family 2 domain-containing protein [Pseudomonadota bacterium]